MSRAGINTTWLVVLCQLAHGLTYTAIPLLLPLIRADLGISFTQAGMLSAVATLSYALGQIPAGFLADRFGARRPFYIGLCGWSALSLCFGLIHDYRLALASQFVAGAFRAMMFAPGLTLLASWFPPQRRATAMSLYMVGGAIERCTTSSIASNSLGSLLRNRTNRTWLKYPPLIGPPKSTATPRPSSSTARTSTSPLQAMHTARQSLSE